MKSIIKQLEKQQGKILDLVQKREDKVDEMSEQWQESEKCADWEDKTSAIEEVGYELDSVIDSLKELI